MHLNRKGYRKRMSWQLGNWEPSQHLSEDREIRRKPILKWPVAGPFGNILTGSSLGNERKLRSPTIRLTYVLLLYLCLNMMVMKLMIKA
jgi:hypothetical protein